MKMKKENATDSFFIAIIAVLLVLVAWNKYQLPLLLLYNKIRYFIALIIAFALTVLLLKLKNFFLKATELKDLEDEILSGEGEESVFAGISKNGKRIFVKESFRRMHTQIVGTTNAGKTESVILPWSIDDMKKGRGFIIIDGKSDRSLLDKLYAYAKRYRRENDVRILSLCNVSQSNTFNPLYGGTPLEITERNFKSLSFENEYFKSLQYEALLQILLIFEGAAITPTPVRVIEAFRSPQQLKALAVKMNKKPQLDWVRDFLSLTREEREQRTSGLVTQLQVFAVGETAPIFNAENSDIDLNRALEEGQIIYCQLPVLKIPTLGKVTGKFILQALQSAIASRHLGSSQNRTFFSVYLDDFTEYLNESFVSLLNKSRSANVAVVFAHQALGDLAVLGDAIKNTILTNANLKIFMRTNEPESAEYFSGVVGTSQTTKITERQKRGLLGQERTGDTSIRDVEEYKFHPNLFKQDLGVGEAVMVLPHTKGSLPVRLKFRKSPDLDSVPLPEIYKNEPMGLPTLEEDENPTHTKLNHKLQHLNQTENQKEVA